MTVSEYCRFCRREFRGVEPSYALERHEAEHRHEAIMAVSCGGAS